MSDNKVCVCVFMSDNKLCVCVCVCMYVCVCVGGGYAHRADEEP